MARQVCEVCEELDLAALFEDETNQQCIGNLSDYNSPNCPFCERISEAIRAAWEKTGDDGWRDLDKPSKDPCQLYVQSRSAVAVNERGRTRYPEPRLLLAADKQPKGLQLNRAAIREVDNIQSRFIFAELESLPINSAAPRPNVPRRAVPDRVDVSLIKSWLTACQSHKHSLKSDEGRHIDLFNPDRPFRLIDVENECLVVKKERCDYVALSYVWGRIPTLLFPGDDENVIPVMLTLSTNVNELSDKPGSLSASRPVNRKTGKVPQTVRDAMKLTRDIDMRYLWVDTLCIVQDSLEDKMHLIGRMDDVYDGAAVTLIAVTGSDANAGLKGVSSRQGRPIMPKTMIADSETNAELSLSIVPPSLCEEVREAAWDTRAWTFQEQALSRRCLYFTEHEIFFNCQERQWREAYDYGEKEQAAAEVRVRTGPPWWSGKLRNDPDPTPYRYLGDAANASSTSGMQEYHSAVQGFSRKLLTFPQDVLNAFEGVYNRFKGSGEGAEFDVRQTQGIPLEFMPIGLLWFPSDAATERIPKPEGGGEETPGFASWSWASWTGPIEFVFADSAWISRNLSHSAIKKVPFYTTIPSWDIGGSQQSAGQKHWLNRVSTNYASHTTKTGIDINLVSQAASPDKNQLQIGELGFQAAYLASDQFRISHDLKLPHAWALELGDNAHRGQFRFDRSGAGSLNTSDRVDELVAIIAGDTITRPADAMTIVIGLSTTDGISVRVGVGYIYYSREKTVPRPAWGYRYFKLI